MKQLVLIGSAVLALGLAACTEDRSAPRDDMTISSEVRKELNDERIAGNIQVRADSGIVTLTGTVATLKDKDRAGDAAKDIKGVKMVQNNLRTTMAGDAPEYQQPRNPNMPANPPGAIPPARGVPE